MSRPSRDAKDKAHKALLAMQHKDTEEEKRDSIPSTAPQCGRTPTIGRGILRNYSILRLPDPVAEGPRKNKTKEHGDEEEFACPPPLRDRIAAATGRGVLKNYSQSESIRPGGLPSAAARRGEFKEHIREASSSEDESDTGDVQNEDVADYNSSDSEYEYATSSESDDDVLDADDLQAYSSDSSDENCPLGAEAEDGDNGDHYLWTRASTQCIL
jgi:hypothetical protein